MNVDLLFSEHSEIVPGAYVSMFSGEWSSARADLGVIVAVQTYPIPMGGTDVRLGIKSIFVYLPTHPKDKLKWYDIDAWHLENFWKVLWSPNVVDI